MAGTGSRFGESKGRRVDGRGDRGVDAVKSLVLPKVRVDTLPRTDEFSKVHNAPPDDESAVGGLADAELLRHRFVRDDAQRRWPGRRLAALPVVQEAARRLYAPDWAWLEATRGDGRSSVNGSQGEGACP